MRLSAQIFILLSLFHSAVAEQAGLESPPISSPLPIVSDNLSLEVDLISAAEPIPLQPPLPTGSPFENYRDLSLNLMSELSLPENHKALLNDLSGQFFHSPYGLNKVYLHYDVKSGEYLSTIARKHKLSLDRLLFFNPELIPDHIFPGQTLKIVTGPNYVLISKSEFKMHLFIKGYFYRTYSIGIGREGKSTPVLKTSVSSSRAKNPDYTHPDTKQVFPFGHPENPIGTRWIGLTCGNGYGIHGTNDETSIGKAMSRGCIRMRQIDLEEVYSLLLTDDIVEIRP